MANNFARILAGAASGYGKVLSDEAEEARKRALLELERQFADAELLEQRADDDENVSGIAEEEAGNRVNVGPRGGLVPGAQFEPGPREVQAIGNPQVERAAFAGGDEDVAGAPQDFLAPPELSPPIGTPIPEARLGPRDRQELAQDGGRLPGEVQIGGTDAQAGSGGGQALADGGIAVPRELLELGQGKRVRDDDSGIIYRRRGDRLMPVVPDKAALPNSAALSDGVALPGSVPQDAVAGPLAAGRQLASAAPRYPAFAAQDTVGGGFAPSEGGTPALSRAPVQTAADAGDTGNEGDAGDAADRGDVYVEYPLNAPANGSGAEGEAEQRWASNELGRLRVIENEAAPGGHLQRTFVVEPTTSLTNPAGWIVQRVVKEYRGELEDGTEASIVAVEHEAFKVNRGRTTTAQREPRKVRGKPDDDFIRRSGNLVRGSVVVTATAQYIRGATIPTDWGSRLDNPHFRTTGEIRLAPGEDPSSWFDDDELRGTPASGAWTTKYTINWGDPQ